MSANPVMAAANYWEERFASEGKIWGEEPSATASQAARLFHEAEAKRLLVAGCGYGRNALFLAREGFQVTGLDVSESALHWLREADVTIECVQGSVLDAELGADSFDAVYALNLLHLFLAPQRRAVADKCHHWLRPGGMAFVAVFAESDFSYGRGAELEPHTFESRPGRPAHYFSDDDLRTLFSEFEILESGTFLEPEKHPPDGPHVHTLRYIYARKPS